MKKIVASVGLVALGASGLHAETAGLTADTSKPWSAAVTLRGFYDDNVASLPDELAQESIGFEVSPTLGWTFNLERTAISLKYTYSLKWYENPPEFTDQFGNTTTQDDFDQSHMFDVSLDHAISPRHSVSLRDSFVIGQEPDLLRANDTFNTFQRVEGDNIRNYGAINFNTQFTPLFGMEAGYANSYWNYDEPEHSATLDRMEHAIHIDGRWQLQPTTVGILGYTFRQLNYTDDAILGVADGEIVRSDTRDSRLHYIYVGAEHSFRPDFTGSFKAGASFVDYFNDPSDESDVAPYVRGTLSYNYLPESFLTVGASYDRSATDLFSVEGDSITQDAQTATIWGSVNHRFTPHIYGNLVGQIQNSKYNGGSLDGDSEWFYLVGLNLEYRFNQHFSTHIGYNFDSLHGESDELGREFTRNRVYIGVTAGY
jgi:hypothetical protein